MQRFFVAAFRCMPDAMPHIECAGERDRLRCHCLGAVGRAREVLSRQCHRCPRSHLVNVKTLLAVLVYLIISHAFLALTGGIGPHTGERCLKYGHFFIGTLYALQEAEAVGRDAKIAWAVDHGIPVHSLQHDCVFLGKLPGQLIGRDDQKLAEALSKAVTDASGYAIKVQAQWTEESEAVRWVD